MAYSKKLEPSSWDGACRPEMHTVAAGLLCLQTRLKSREPPEPPKCSWRSALAGVVWVVIGHLESQAAQPHGILFIRRFDLLIYPQETFTYGLGTRVYEPGLFSNCPTGPPPASLLGAHIELPADYQLGVGRAVELRVEVSHFLKRDFLQIGYFLLVNAPHVTHVAAWIMD